MPTLDIEDPRQLTDYLRHSGRVAPAEQPKIRVLAGGVSNRTVLVERESGPAWVIKQALEKLRVSVDWYSSPERIHREALGLRWLNELAPPGSTTAFVFEDFEFHLLAMEAVPQPHANWKSELLAGRLDLAHVEQFAGLLAAIHRESHRRREEVAPVFEDRSFFRSLRVEPYYTYTGEQVPEAAGFLAALTEESLACRLSLVHGDYSPKNVLLYRDRVILLDHEVIHFGDPAFDVGFSLTHLLSKAHHLPRCRHAFEDAARRYWHVYREHLGEKMGTGDLEARAARHTLGCLLARVAGRSPLEYLDAEERRVQRAAVMRLMQAPPDTMDALITGFVRELEPL